MRSTESETKRGAGRVEPSEGVARGKGARGSTASTKASAPASKSKRAPTSKSKSATKLNSPRRVAAASATDHAADGTADSAGGRDARARSAVVARSSGRSNRDDELVDRITGAWGAIVVERIAADQDFAAAFERYRTATKDIRAIFAWDEVLSAEAHLSLVNGIIARHSDTAGRADPFAILADLHEERRRLAAVYAVNAFRAVLGQMSQKKPRWRDMDGGDFDERIAVLALAHQALSKALEIARVAAPADLTEPTLDAAQDRAVWAVRRTGAEGLVLASLQAASIFFARIGADTFADASEIGRLYAVQPARPQKSV